MQDDGCLEKMTSNDIIVPCYGPQKKYFWSRHKFSKFHCHGHSFDTLRVTGGRASKAAHPGPRTLPTARSERKITIKFKLCALPRSLVGKEWTPLHNAMHDHQNTGGLRVVQPPFSV